MDTYSQIATKIIELQETIIGPVALEQAGHVSNLTLDWSNHRASVKGDGKIVIDQLVGQYEKLFGKISVEVSKDAVSTLTGQLPPDKLPNSLK